MFRNCRRHCCMSPQQFSDDGSLKSAQLVYSCRKPFSASSRAAHSPKPIIGRFLCTTSGAEARGQALPGTRTMPLGVVGVLVLLLATIGSCEYTQLCRCSCGANYTISVVPSCMNCTRQYCVDTVDFCQKDTITLNDVVTSCFHRESTKDALIIYGFLLVTAGLLAYASLSRYGTSWLEVRKKTVGMSMI